MDLCKELIKRGHKSDVACFNTCAYSKETFPAEEIIEGIIVHRMPYLDLTYYKIAPSVLKIVKNYDIIHVHGVGFFSDFLAITKIFHKKRMVLSTYGGIFHTHALWALKKIYFFGWCKLMVTAFKKIIAISLEDEKLARKISNNVELIDAGIDYGYFSSVKKKTDKNMLVYVGRISKNKRVDNLIKTMAHLKKRITNVRLYVIGDDWENLRNGIEKTSQKLGVNKNVVFTGKVSNDALLEYLSKANFFVSASEYESFGLSAVESMASGCIPILNNNEAFKKLITDGSDGFLVDFSDSKQTAEKIYRIFQTKLEPIRKNAVNTSKKYDWSKTADKIESFYSDLL